MKNNNPDILVTGGGGFLGKAIIRQLIARNEKVCSFSRQFYPELEKMGVVQIQGDIADKVSVENACKGMESVFHVAAKPGVWGDYDEYYRANVVGTENVIAACFEHKVSRLIYTSSPSVVFNGKDMEGVNESVPYPETYHAHYPKTKAIAEKLVIAAAKKGLKTIILRPHLIWGPGDNHLVPRILAKAKRLRKIGDGRNLVDTIYIDNAAHAHILAADKLISNPELSGKIYFISQDEPIALWDMVNAILEAGGLAPVKGSVSPTIAKWVGTIIEGIYRLFHLPGEPPMTRFMAEELATAHWFDIRAAKQDLGYVPLISTQEGLKRLGEYLARMRLS